MNIGQARKLNAESGAKRRARNQIQDFEHNYLKLEYLITTPVATLMEKL